MTTGKKVLIFFIIFIIVGTLVGVGIYNASRREDSSGIPRNAIPVQFEHPHLRTITSRVSAKGSVELLDRITIYPTTQARIEHIHIRVGDEINEGDLLITYDPKTLETYLDQLAEAQLALKSAELALSGAKIPTSRAELQQADAQIRQAQRGITDIEAQVRQIELNRDQLNVNLDTAEKRAADTRSLFTLGIATEKELDAALEAVTGIQNQLDSIALQLETALNGIPVAEENIQLAQTQYDTLANRLNDPRTRNQIQTLEVNVEQMQLRINMIQKNIDEFTHAEYAAHSGTVLMVYAAEGDMAVSGRPLFDIADVSNDNLVIRINIPESDARNINIGQPAEIKGAALGTSSFDGYVSKIHPLAERKPVGNAVETVLTVEISPSDEIRLRAGYSIDTTITTGVQEDVLVVPLMSTLSDPDDGYFVYVMAEDFTVQRKLITIGEYSGLYVQADGVTEEDRIILNPTNQIREGVFVRPIAGLNQ